MNPLELLQPGTPDAAGEVRVTTVAHDIAARLLSEASEAGARPCPVRDVLDRVGDTWSVMVALRLGLGPHRFGALRRSVDGISQRMLSSTLRSLEREGLVQRTVLGTRPVSVEYSLTPLGASMLAPIEALARWATAHESQMRSARERYDAAQHAEPVPGRTVHRLGQSRAPARARTPLAGLA